MKIVVFGALEGNMDALDAAVRATSGLGPALLLQAGGLFGAPETASALADRLRTSGMLCVQGPVERLVAGRRFTAKGGDMAARAAAVHATLNTAQVEWLNALRWKRRCDAGGLGIVLCHGSVTTRNEVLEAGAPEPRLRRQREAEAFDLAVCGGGVEPYARFVDGALFIGPGRLADGDGNTWITVVDTGRSPWQVERTACKIG